MSDNKSCTKFYLPTSQASMTIMPDMHYWQVRRDALLSEVAAIERMLGKKVTTKDMRDYWRREHKKE